MNLYVSNITLPLGVVSMYFLSDEIPSLEDAKAELKTNEESLGKTLIEPFMKALESYDWPPKPGDPISLNKVHYSIKSKSVS